jgi:lipoyl(octanoyl) transferase
VPDLTGVWVRTTDAADADDYDAKIAAIGVRLSASGITSHGFALNIAPDLRGFEQIIPCGIRQRRVTSLEYLLGSAPPFDEVAERVIAQFAEVFEARLLIEEQTWLNLSP